MWIRACVTCSSFLLPAKWCRGKRSDKGEDPKFILSVSCPFQAVVLAAPGLCQVCSGAVSAKARQNAAAAPEMHLMGW